MFSYIIFVTNLLLYTMLRLLSIITFLICICFIESKGDIKNNISLDDAYVSNVDTTGSTSFGSVGKCILITTVLNSTLEEFNLIGDLIAGANRTERIRMGNREIVMFFNPTRDTTLIREVNLGSDETYKVFVR
jgi:hypothetical protein